jgi:hypothetical protein
LVKQFRGFRFEQELYEAFCRLAEKQGLTTTRALERFMEGSVAIDTLVFADRRVLDFEAEARVLVDWLIKGKHFYRDEKSTELNISGRLLTLLPKVTDTDLKKKIEEALKSSVPKQNNI